jgi:glycerol-3-phosphate dehydrogenase
MIHKKQHLKSKSPFFKNRNIDPRSGIRPLVKDPNKTDTQSLVRNHVVHVSPGNLVTIAGGKWTTYRVMAQETIDAAVKSCNLKPKNDSRTGDSPKAVFIVCFQTGLQGSML